MRNISFQLTTRQIKNRTKTVTRRLGWKNLKPSTYLRGCEKCMGLKKGEKINKLCTIYIVDVRRERLCDITEDDVIKEGFPRMNALEFINMFCREMKCEPSIMVTRIEFKYERKRVI